MIVHLLNTNNSGPNYNFQFFLMSLKSHNLLQLTQCILCLLINNRFVNIGNVKKIWKKNYKKYSVFMCFFFHSWWKILFFFVFFFPEKKRKSRQICIKIWSVSWMHLVYVKSNLKYTSSDEMKKDELEMPLKYISYILH